MRKVILTLALACCLVVSQVIADDTPRRENELRYNGNDGSNQELQPPSPPTSQEPQPPSSPTNQRGRQRDPSGLPQGSIDPFGYGLGGRFSGFVPSDPFGLIDSLFRPMSRFGMGPLEDFFNSIPEQIHQFDREYESLEEGERKETNYFQRDGKAYVKTCITKRVTPGQEVPTEQMRVLPYDRQQSLREKQRQQPQQPQQQQESQQETPPVQEQPASNLQTKA